MHPTESLQRVTTGVAGLDEIMRGGPIAYRTYMVRGGPGAGKTILGLHFLTSASTEGEPTLFITFGESEAELRRNAGLLGFDTSNITFLDLSPDGGSFADGHQQYDIFPPSDVEREPVARRIRETASGVRPVRVFVDGMTQLRHLTNNQFQFRKESLSFLRYLTDLGATVMFTSESNEGPDEDLQFIADGVINLEFENDRRRIAIKKFRGSDFRSGFHTLSLTNAGIQVFPRLLPEDHTLEFQPEQVPFGIPELDQMAHGGLERGTITIVTGPSGVGKSTLGMHFVHSAAMRGEHSAVYLFEESRASALRRCEGIGLPLRELANRGALTLQHIEPLRFTADEFALIVRQQVERQNTRIVMIDSVAGYRLALRDEDLVEHLHALAKYLQNMGVAVLLMNEVEAITGDFRLTDVGVSYMADNIVFLRYLELNGEITKAIGILKKRLTDFEKTLREFTITAQGIQVGRKLTGLRGILSGSPEWKQ